MSCSINRCFSSAGQKYSSCINNLGAALWMKAPFASSAGVGTIMSGAAKIAGLATPFWPVFQMMFGICVGLHTAIVAPLQTTGRKKNYVQVFIGSAITMAWALRVGSMNAVFFDVLKHMSMGSSRNNKYVCLFWDIISIAVLLPIIANPICDIKMGVVIVVAIAIASLVSKYIGECPYDTAPRVIAGPLESVTHDSNSEVQDSSTPYFDQKSQTYYYNPPAMKELSALAEEFQVKGNYAGISFGRNRRFTILGQPEQLCDMICLIKKREQIEYENQPVAEEESSPFQERVLQNIKERFALEVLPIQNPFQSVKERIKTQEALGNLLIELGKEILGKWNYSAFHICTKKELQDNGYNEQDISEMHTLVLFYKPLPSEQP